MVNLHRYLTNKAYVGYKLSNLQYRELEEDNRFKVNYIQSPEPELELGEASLEYPVSYRALFLYLKRTKHKGDTR